jgi:hypothetical protein
VLASSLAEHAPAYLSLGFPDLRTTASPSRSARFRTWAALQRVNELQQRRTKFQFVGEWDGEMALANRMPQGTQGRVVGDERGQCAVSAFDHAGMPEVSLSCAERRLTARMRVPGESGSSCSVRWARKLAESEGSGPLLIAASRLAAESARPGPRCARRSQTAQAHHLRRGRQWRRCPGSRIASVRYGHHDHQCPASRLAMALKLVQAARAAASYQRRSERMIYSDMKSARIESSSLITKMLSRPRCQPPGRSNNLSLHRASNRIPLYW